MLAFTSICRGLALWKQVWQHAPEKGLAQLMQCATNLDDPELLASEIYAQTELHHNKDFDINEKDSFGATALSFAVMQKNAGLFHMEIVEMLIENGANPNSQDCLGFTSLFIATGLRPSVEIAKYLIEKGKASVDIKNINGVTALHGAALCGNKACVELLLKYGADPRAETKEGDIPVHWAIDEDIRRLLFKVMRRNDDRMDKLESQCAWCKHIPVLPALPKRCSYCRVTMYCSKKCQLKDWKEGSHQQNCAGFLILKPRRDDMIRDAFLIYPNPAVAMAVIERLSKPSPSYLTKKQLVIKVEILPEMRGFRSKGLRVSSEDDSVLGEIKQKDPVYRTLRATIENENGRKEAHFWGEVINEPNGAIKLFPGKVVSAQKW